MSTPCRAPGWASPGEAVLLGDREPYVAGAMEAGMRAVWFRGDNAAAVAEITGILRGLSGLACLHEQCV